MYHLSKKKQKKIVRFWSESAIYQQGKRSWFSSGLAEILYHISHKRWEIT